MSDHHDVIVVGAGISGLTTARFLLSRDPNLKVLVLEAKDRVGGRTLTVDLKTGDGTDAWDLGGQWVGRCQPHIMNLLDELGIDTYHQYCTGTKLCQAGTKNSITSYASTIPNLSAVALLDLHRFMSKADMLAANVDPLNPFITPDAEKWDGMTLETFVNDHVWTRECKDVIAASLQTVFGAETSQISVLYFLMYIAAAGNLMNLMEAENQGAQEFRIKGGAQQISLQMAKEIDPARIHTGEPVMWITQGQEKVEVTTALDNTYTCQKLVLAIPPGQIGKLSFTPRLPVETREIIKRMPPSNIIKFIVTYKEPFWQAAGLSGEVVSNGGPTSNPECDSGPVCLVFDATTSNNSPALLGFIGGQTAVQWQKQTEESRRSAVLGCLEQFFGNSVWEFMDYREMIWDTEPFTEGAPVSCVGPGAMRYLNKGLRHPFGKIHFAGTESATMWCGFMSGAVQAGRRAAIEVLYDLRPQLVSADDLCESKTMRRPKLVEHESWNRKLVRWTIRLGVVYLVVVSVRKMYSKLQPS